MDERCPGCDCGIEERLKNLQVLRHIMMTKKKEYDKIRKERCTDHEEKTGVRKKPG